MAVRKAPGALTNVTDKHNDMQALRALITSSLILVLLYLFLGSFWFQPWYLMWPIALAALMSARRGALAFVAVLSASALCAAVFKDYANAQSSSALPTWLSSTLTVTITWLPTLIALCYRNGDFSRPSAAASIPETDKQVK